MTDLEQYEIEADAFYRMTGMMAPGKDSPAAAGPTDYEERLAAWIEWHKQYGLCIRAILAATSGQETEGLGD